MEWLFIVVKAVHFHRRAPAVTSFKEAPQRYVT